MEIILLLLLLLCFLLLLIFDHSSVTFAFVPPIVSVKHHHHHHHQPTSSSSPIIITFNEQHDVSLQSRARFRNNNNSLKLRNGAASSADPKKENATTATVVSKSELEESSKHNKNVTNSLAKESVSKEAKKSSPLPVPDPLVVYDKSPTYSSLDFDAAYVLLASGIIGIISGCAVSFFKLSIESLRELLYGTALTETLPMCFVPALGGLGVAALAMTGKFSQGLRGTATEIDALSINTMQDERFKDGWSFVRKPLAAIATLGSGNSLGPEGPSVEIGMSVSRILMPPTPTNGRVETYAETASRIRRNRLLLSAGAASGVAAGFNAPLAGVFFALEIVQQYQPSLYPNPDSISSSKIVSTFTKSTLSSSASSQTSSALNPENWFQTEAPDFLSGPGAITAILLASVMSALISQAYLGDSLALSVPSYDLKQPLIELPLYLLLGVISGVVAGSFSALAQFSKGVFDGTTGPLSLQKTMRMVPKWSKPAMGGLIVGVIGIVYPQVLFFGYETLNTLLAKAPVSADLVFALLVVKTFTTAISAGSGLVGGTFAPSLFLGGMVGASFHNVMQQMFLNAHASHFELADQQAYALVGAAGVLAALFRAPLTASLLLFEVTRDYEVILPVVAAAGVGSVIGDLVEKNWEENKRDRDAVSWGDLSDKNEEEGQQ